MPAKGQKKPAAERFWPKVDKVSDPNGCWLWTGAVVRGGYGFFHDGTSNGVAHRWAFEAKFGPIPDGLLACHKCDNPRCVNPDHIFLGTHFDNQQDKVRKGRQRVVRATPLYRQKLSPINETHCRRGHLVQIDRDGRRRCRECHRIRAHERYSSDPAYRARVIRRNGESRRRSTQRRAMVVL